MTELEAQRQKLRSAQSGSRASTPPSDRERRDEKRLKEVRRGAGFNRAGVGGGGGRRSRSGGGGQAQLGGGIRFQGRGRVTQMRRKGKG